MSYSTFITISNHANWNECIKIIYQRSSECAASASQQGSPRSRRCRHGTATVPVLSCLERLEQDAEVVQRRGHQILLVNCSMLHKNRTTALLLPLLGSSVMMQRHQNAAEGSRRGRRKLWLPMPGADPHLWGSSCRRRPLPCGSGPGAPS